MKEEDRYDLLLDEKNGPILVEDECKVFKPILEDFVNNLKKLKKGVFKQIKVCYST